MTREAIALVVILAGFALVCCTLAIGYMRGW